MEQRPTRGGQWVRRSTDGAVGLTAGPTVYRGAYIPAIFPGLERPARYAADWLTVIDSPFRKDTE